MRVQNLKKTYGERTVLNIEKFNFEPQKIYAIIGANGCGKTTFLRMMSGIIKSDDKNARVDFDGVSPMYMPQKNYAFKMSALNNVLISASSGLSKEESRAYALEIMGKMKIDHLSSKRATSLSGGETSRMVLCRMIMSGAEILLLDEPTAAMDIESTILSEKLISEYRREKNATIIMVTHSVKQAARLADEIIFMKDGQIVECGDKNTVLSLPKHSDTKEFLDFFSSEI